MRGVYVVPVVRCEHGHYDPHPVVPVGGDWYNVRVPGSETR